MQKNKIKCKTHISQFVFFPPLGSYWTPAKLNFNKNTHSYLKLAHAESVQGMQIYRDYCKHTRVS